MNEEMVAVVNSAIAKHISDSIPELEIVSNPEEGWEWQTKEDSSAEWHETPLEALIDFAHVILMDNKRLMKEAESND